MSHYHDNVWGTRTHDESAMFEALTLGVFEAGLSWMSIGCCRTRRSSATWPRSTRPSITRER
ncbi:MAG TPA: DNA-3-methyladenine glycosylase I [Streptosporangiaceae bacterium]|nr:DNA-3-methyladenine glycosylase I [Streptosporangiaceae bacterium]